MPPGSSMLWPPVAVRMTAPTTTASGKSAGAFLARDGTIAPMLRVLVPRPRCGAAAPACSVATLATEARRAAGRCPPTIKARVLLARGSLRTAPAFGSTATVSEGRLGFFFFFFDALFRKLARRTLPRPVSEPSDRRLPTWGSAPNGSSGTVASAVA